MKYRRFLILLLLVALTGGGLFALWQHYQPSSPLQKAVEQEVAAYRFSVERYELRAVAQEAGATLARPGSRLAEEKQIDLVRDYLLRARRIAAWEDKVNAIYANPDIADPETASASLRAQVSAARALQKRIRPLVETILQQQITATLAEQGLTEMGIVWPPVRFNFSELPNYLIVSPRETIRLDAGVYLQPALDMSTIEDLEDETAATFQRSTLIEPLGGLGVWPTMVIDSASLRWTLSTIAHEWVHNTMVFHPLGWHLYDEPAMNTVSETVATIIGNEIGDLAAWRYYGLPLPTPTPPATPAPTPPTSPEFDFQREMRRTRLHVDELLAAGQVEEAERYMEERRQVFVAHGYAIRKLNQAYFAFHGSYATTAAATDPIGPKLRELRSYTPDLATFMHEVTGIKQAADVDSLLEKWRQRYESELAQARAAGN